MPTLLQIDSSPMGEASVSRQLTREFAQRWLNANPRGKIIARDLTTVAIPVIDATWVSANYTPKEARSREQHELLSLSTKLITELKMADEYVISTPMHNWGPSASLKLWIDQIVRFGETIEVTSSGPRGMLKKQKATFIIAAGGVYRSGSANASQNYLEPWFRSFFSYLGVKDMQFIVADGARDLLHGRIDRATFIAPYIKAVEELFTEEFAASSSQATMSAGSTDDRVA